MSGGLALLYAVVVGWNGSPSPDVPPLRFADDDAAEYARLLRDAGARTTLLTTLDADSRALHADARPDGPPTRDALLGALARIDREMAQDGRPAELVIVYTGHGDVDHGEGFVMLDGARLTRGDLQSRVLGGRRAARIHVIVDACKSYYLVFARGGEHQRRGRKRHDAPFALDGALGPAAMPHVGFALSTSSDADSHEWEEVQGGVFSHEVRSALRGAADVDGDGRVSYAELGAFVRTANLGIANPRFRPRFTVIPPLDSALGERTPLLGWDAPGRRGTHVVRLDAPGLGRVSVEDALGRRLLDTRLGATTVRVHLPRETLYVWDRSGDREYALDGGTLPDLDDAHPTGAAPELALSTVAPRPRRFASRGAQQDAFGQLFSRPFEGAAVDEWIQRPQDPDGADARPPTSRRRIATLITVGLAASAGVAAIGCTAGALALRGGAGESQQERAAVNQRLDALNGAAVGLYAVAGAAGVASAILGLWPAPARTIAPAPGPGTFGLSLVGTLP